MSSLTHEVPMSKVMRQITLEIRITGAKVMRARVWLAAQIMKLAGLIAGCEIRVESGGEFDELPPLPRTRHYMMVGGLEIPRQASCREGSPLYVSNAWDWGQKVDFFLDGEKQSEVISYDLDAGYMRVLKHGPNGDPYVAGDELATEIRTGKIEVKPVEPTQ